MTPAINAARKAGIEFAVHEYTHDPNARAFGLEAATQLGLDPGKVFKTLVLETDNQSLAVAMIPVATQLSMKLAARALGCKKASLAPRERAERATGYIMGGISPLGQKKRLPMVLDKSALAHPVIYVSGGRRGLDLELAPAELQRMTGASTAALAATGPDSAD